MTHNKSFLWLSLIGLVFFGGLRMAVAEPRITIIHTSDLHSHFSNEQSPRRLGGYARIKTKIDELRKKNPDSLLLDSGDWSEGNIFFTLNSGEASQRMLEAFGYDAIVLGNHDWLAGPKDLYEAFLASGMKIPVLSANLNLDGLPPEMPLGRYIQPFLIKTVAGKKVGIVGLSTFQLIFDHFFTPVNVIEPIRAARKVVKYLRETEKCDVVIALTHTGQETDRLLARTVPGLDLIVGGHSHVLFQKPVYVKGVPIVHTGMWGQHVGEYQLSIDLQGRVSLVGHKIHQIDTTIPEDEKIRLMTQDFQSAVEKQYGAGVFKEKIFQTDTSFRLVKKDLFSNDTLGNWSVDAIREAAGADVGFDSPMFASTQLQKGWISEADMFNLFPHIYSKSANESWTIRTYKIKGFVLRSLVGLMVKFHIPFKISNGQIIVEGKEATKIRSFKIGGVEIEMFRDYTIASTRGVLDVFTELNRLGLPFFGPKDLKDTGKPMWREVMKKLASVAPITLDKIKWDGRVRTLQPDPGLLKEFIQVNQPGDRVIVNVRVYNGGMQASAIPKLTVMVDPTPDNSTDESWLGVPMKEKFFQAMLPAGEYMEYEGELPAGFRWNREFLPVLASIKPVFGEVSLKNNLVTNDLEYLPIVRDNTDSPIP